MNDVMLPVMILSFGYLILRQALQLITLVNRGGHANAVEVLVLRHQVILSRRGFVTPQPHKRPRSSYIRFKSYDRRKSERPPTSAPA